MPSSLDNKYSRYTKGGEVEDVTSSKLKWWERKDIKPSASDMPFIVTRKYVGRPDLISSRIYGDAQLMWVVLQFNGVLDIHEDLVEGTELRVPTRERLFFEILS